MSGVEQTQHVRWFAGQPTALAVGEPTTTTASLGNAVVYGRPYSLDGPITLDPEGPVPTLRRALRSLDGKFSLLAVGGSTAVLATDALGCGPAYYAARSGSVHVASQLGPLVRLLDGGVTLDPVGTAAAVAGSVSVGGRTPYDGVHRLQAGQFAVIDLASGRIQVESYGSVEEIFGVDHEAPGCPGRGDAADPCRRGSRGRSRRTLPDRRQRLPDPRHRPHRGAARSNPRADVRRVALH